MPSITHEALVSPCSQPQLSMLASVLTSQDVDACSYTMVVQAVEMIASAQSLPGGLHITQRLNRKRNQLRICTG